MPYSYLMVNQDHIDRVYNDIKYQTPRFQMQQGYCEVSMMLLNIIDDMNKELESLKEKVKQYEMDNE